MPAPLLCALLLQLPVPVASLDVRVDGEWRAWQMFVVDAPAKRDPTLARAIAWRDSAAGVRVGDFEVRVSGKMLRNSIAVVELDPSRFVFSLVPTPPDGRRTADEIIRDSSVVLVTNTGLFRPDGTPQGLVLVDGVRRSALAGWLDAVVVFEGGAPGVTTIQGARSLPVGTSAFQTLPWLVRDGRVVLGTGSGVRLSRTHRDRRITLCLGSDGLVRLALSNFEFMGQDAGRVPIGLTIPEQALVASALGCRDAVALDGGISAQLAVRVSRVHRMPGWRRVPLLMVVRRR